MWIQVDEEELKLLMLGLAKCQDYAIAGAAELDAKIGAQVADHDLADPYRAALQGEADDEMEVDEDAIVSPGSDPGAFVHAWIWVSDQQAGIFCCEQCSGVFTLDRRITTTDGYICDECGAEDEDACRDCGEHYEDGGDGYNGRCPTCADKAEEEGRSDD